MKSFFQQHAAVMLIALLAGTFASAQEAGSSSAGTTSSSRSSGGGLFIEPMITGESSDSKIKTSQLAPAVFGDTEGKVEGAGLGLRFGGHVADVFFVAADARYSRPTFKDSSYDNATSPGYNYGLTVGGQTPYFGVRVWGTGVFGGEMDPAAGANSFDVKFRDARGYRVGGGVHFAAVAVNLEYQELTYGNTQVQNAPIVGGINEVTDVDFEQKGAILSLSFPVEL